MKESFQWNPDQYLIFENERSRPFHDLLGRIPRQNYRRIVDLGCGPGNLTEVLALLWPEALVTGVDKSPEMLAEGRKKAVSGLQFVHGDVSSWEPEEPVDLLLSNAVLQWVGNHEVLVPRLAKMVRGGGTLAVQIPQHLGTPAHRAIAEVVQREPWKKSLSGTGLQPGCVKVILWYVGQLLDLGFQVDAWETTYVHVLRGDNPVLEWMKGTALRPFMEKLKPENQEVFLGEVGEGLRAAYPAKGAVTLFPYPRLFFVSRAPTRQPEG